MTSYDTYIGLFAGAFILCYVLVPLVKRAALEVGASDPPSERRIHQGQVPTLGGIAVAVPVYLGIGVLYCWPNAVSRQFFESEMQVVALLIGANIILGLGLYDDLRGAGAVAKFTGQILAALVVCLIADPIYTVSMPFVGSTSLGLAAVPVTVFWIVLVTNAFNFIDGIDGLAAGVGVVVCAGNFLVAARSGRVGMMVFSSLLGGGLLAFLRYNFHPASIFLGDTGSLFIGFSIAVVAMQSSMKTSTSMLLFFPICVLGYPLADLSLAVLRRYVKGKPLFTSDRSHIHHKLLSCGLEHRGVCLVGYTLAALFTLMAILHMYGRRVETLLLTVVLTGVFFLMFRHFGYIDFIRDRLDLALRRRYRLVHLIHEVAELKIRNCSDLDEAGSVLEWVAGEFDLVGLQAEIQGGVQCEWQAEQGNHEAAGENHEVEIPGDLGRLKVIHPEGKNEDMRIEQNILIERLAGTLAEMVQKKRVRAAGWGGIEPEVRGEG